MTLNLDSKEGKQALGLIIFTVLAGLYLSYRFVIKPFTVSRNKQAEKIEQLDVRIRKMDAMLARKKKIREGVTKVNLILEEAFEKNIPSMDHPLSWVTQLVYAHARKVGAEIQWIEKESSSYPAYPSGAVDTSAFKPYSAKISATASYFDIVRFLDLLTKGNPYLSIRDIHVTARTKDPEIHQFTLIVEWPIPRDRNLAKEFRKPELKPTASRKRKPRWRRT